MTNSDAKACFECNSFYHEDKKSIHYIQHKKGNNVCFSNNISQIIFTITGRFIIKGNGVKNYVCHENEMVLLTEKHEYTLAFQEDSELITMDYTSNFLNSDFLGQKNSIEICNNLKYRFHSLEMRQPIKNLAKQLIDYLKDEINYVYIHKLKSIEAFILLKHYYTCEELFCFFYPTIHKSSSFKSLVLKKYQHSYAVGELAEACGYKYSNFEKIFKRNFGISPYQWMQRQKASHIKSRLQDYTVPIKAVALEFGFADQSHLNAYCRRYFNATPKEIRFGIKQEHKLASV